MKQALTNMTLGCLRVSGSGAGAGAGAEANGKDEPKAVKYYDDDALPGDEPRIFEPEMRRIPASTKNSSDKACKSPAKRSRQSSARKSVPAVKTVTPPRVPHSNTAKPVKPTRNPRVFRRKSCMRARIDFDGQEFPRADCSACL